MLGVGSNIAVLVGCSKSSRRCNLLYLLTYLLTYLHLQGLHMMSKGHMLADVVTIIGTRVRVRRTLTCVP